MRKIVLNRRRLTAAAMVVYACALCAQNDTLHSHQMTEVEVKANRVLDVHALTAVRSLSVADHLRLGVVDMGDALRRMPGVTLRDYGGAGGRKSIAIRGLGSQHTGVSYDGVTLTECQTGSIDLSRYTLEQAANVSLSIGGEGQMMMPARQLAYPAVLSIETTDGSVLKDKKPHLNATLTAGSFLTFKPFVKYLQGLGHGWALSATLDGLYSKNNFPYKLQNGTTIQRERRANSQLWNGHGELDVIHEHKNNELRLKFYGYTDSRQLPGQVRYYTNVSGEELDERNNFAQLQYTYRGFPKLTLKGIAKYNYFKSDYKDELSLPGKSLAIYKQREAYASLMLGYTPLKGMMLNYAGDYAFNNLWGSQETVTRPLRHTMLHAFSVLYTWRMFTIQGRMLGSYYFNDDHRGPAGENVHRWSPNVMARVNIPGKMGLSIRASYKDIFRMPTFNELYYYHYGSTDLKPENTRQGNFGLGWNYNKKGWDVEVGVDAYANRVTDKIVSVPYNLFIWRTINVAKVKGKGVELNTRIGWQVMDKHKLDASLTGSVQAISNRTNAASSAYGKQIAYIPKRTGSASLGWENPWLNLVLSAYAQSDCYTTNDHVSGTRVDGFYEMNLGLYRRWKWGRGVLTTRMDVRNLLDERYQLVARYPMPGRNWQMTFNYQF